MLTFAIVIALGFVALMAMQATVSATIPTKSATVEENKAVLWKWTPLTSANNVGDQQETAGLSQASVQFSGIWGSATAVLQGSNDGTTWFTLHDPAGNSISVTADALKAISELTRYVRPSTSGGDGTQSLTCILVGSRG